MDNLLKKNEQKKTFVDYIRIIHNNSPKAIISCLQIVDTNFNDTT